MAHINNLLSWGWNLITQPEETGIVPRTTRLVLDKHYYRRAAWRFRDESARSGLIGIAQPEQDQSDGQ